MSRLASLNLKKTVLRNTPIKEKHQNIRRFGIWYNDVIFLFEISIKMIFGFTQLDRIKILVFLGCIHKNLNVNVKTEKKKPIAQKILNYGHPKFTIFLKTCVVF